MRHWHALLTKPRQECIATVQLERQGYEGYLPMVRERCRERGTGKVRTAPHALLPPDLCCVKPRFST